MNGVLGIGVQDLAVFAVVLGALAWLTRRWWRRRKRGTCTCDGCPVGEQAMSAAVAAAPERAGSGLITIESPGPKAH